MALSEDEAVALLSATSPSARKLATQFRVSVQTVRNYKTLRLPRAQDVADRMRQRGVEPVIWESDTWVGTPARIFTPEQVRMIRASKANSVALADELRCASATIRMIRTRSTYREIE